MPPIPEKGPLFSLVENIPGNLFYIPVALAWPYFALRYGGLTLPASANTNIVIGGWCSESKTDVLNLLGAFGRAHMAPFVTVTATHDAEETARAMRLLTAAGIHFPIVAKPDTGRNGSGVKIVRDQEALSQYLTRFPKGQLVVLQHYVKGPGEAGVFYVRKPSEKQGRITSLTLKYFPQVTGDGSATLRELIMRDKRANKIADIYFRRNARELDRILPRGETRPIVSVGNHVRGSVFVDGAPYITDAMQEAFDKICKEMPGFHFGRFDVRFENLEDLQAGKNFSIIEFNGTGSEPTHIYDRRSTLLGAYGSLLQHYRLSFEIGAENRKRGSPPITIREIIRRYYEELEKLSYQPDEE